jgi:S1-C subfamily serine protease
MAVTPLTPELAAQLDLPRNESGLVVTDVEPSSVAAGAGLRAGDVVTRVNGHDVKSVPELRKALDERRNAPALVRVIREGSHLFVALPVARS